MVQSQSGGTRTALVRFSALLLSVFLISLGISDLLTRSWAATGDDEDPDYPQLYEDVAQYLRQHYLDQDRLDPRARKLTEKALSAMENMVDEIWVENSDPDNPFVVVHVGDKSKVLSLAKVTNLNEAIEALRDLTQFIKASYHGKRTINDIRYFAVNGFLSGLDPHTQVFNPKAFQEFSVHIKGRIFGVGMYVGTTKGVLTVKKVLKGTPAEKAGFKRGDRIVKIGEESTVNMDVNEAVKKIRGPEHSKVVLTVKRKESKESENMLTLPIEVEREQVTIPSVVAKLLDPPAKGTPEASKPAVLGYVQVNNFDENTVPSLKEALEGLRDEAGGRDLGGLILDLRENSGGLLQQAQDMADMFLPKGELYWIAQKGQEREQDARNERNEPRYPIVALANEHSASGAEIVVGALQKNGRAVVLGTPTFGKGSVQQLHGLRHDWQLKITVSEYLIPGKISIQENGVIPNILADRVVITDKVINLFPNRRYGTEKDYGDHIVSRYARHEEPEEKIQFLAEVEDADEEDPDTDPVGLGEIDPAKDTLIRIGKKILGYAVGDSGGQEAFKASDFLERHRADVDQIRREHFDLIVKELKARGIDWREGSNPEKPAVEVSIEHSRILKPSGDKDDPVPKPFLHLTARAENRSREPLYRIKAITESDYFPYKEQEFLFGQLEPGATVERSVDVPIPYYPYARNDAIELAVSDASGKPFLTKEHDVVLEQEARPSFTYAATLLKKEDQAPRTGLAPGQQALLKIKMFNTGKAMAHKGVAILRNQTGAEVFLEPPGRIEFSELAPKGEKDVEFSFRITEGSSAKKYRFELGMVDSYSGESLSREMEISAEGSGGPAFPNGEEFHPPLVEASLLDPAVAARDSGGNGGGGGGDVSASPAPERTRLLLTDRAEVELTAKVSGSQAPFNAWVTVSPVANHEEDPDKVYLEESHGKTGLDFNTRVPLKKGVNVIHVIASDQNGLQSREVLVVRRR